MKGIIRFSLKNKFAVWIMTVIVIVAGLYSGMTMKQETIPNIDVPILTMSTVIPGAAPEEVADKVTRPLEQRIKNLNAVDVLESTSMENVSSIVVQYKYGKNMDEAKDELKQAIADFELPTGAQDIQISKISLNDFPVISLSISGKNQSLEEITQLVESEVKPALESIDGAGTVSISGQQVKEVQLTFDQAKLKQLGLSEDTVKAIIQGSAVKAPLGLFEIDKSEKTIVVDGNVTTVDDLKNLAIPAIPSGAGAGAASGAAGAAGSNGQAASAAGAGAAAAQGIPTVKLSDIANVQMISKAESISRTNGLESIGINVTKTSDANTVDVVNHVKDEAEKIEKDHPGVKAVVLLDQGKPIEDSVSTMLTKAVFGALFAIIVIMLFLRNIRTTLISVVSIPLSLLIAVLILKQMDITLNIMSLGAMTVAIGRVVDDSIVVIENNFRRMSLRSEPLKGRELVIDATREMFIPIMSSTLVTIAVFLPLGLVSGMIGELFMPFALTMVFALLASLLVAITVVPAMAHFMFRKGLKTTKEHHENSGALGNFYRRVLQWTLNHKAVTSIIAVLLLVGSICLTPLVGVSFLPEEEQKYVLVTYSPAPGSTIDDVEKMSLDAEKMIMNRKNVTNLQYSVGAQSQMMATNSKSALFYVEYKDDTPDFKDVKDKLVQDLSAQIDPKGKWATMDFSGGVGGSKLSLFVYGDTMEDVKTAADKVQALMEKNKSLEKVDTSLSQSYEQYTLVADQQKLSKLGLTAGQIAMKLSPQRQSDALTNIETDGKEYPVYVNVDQKSYSTITDIENTTVASPLGIEVPVKDLVTVQEGTSPNTITQKDGRLYAQIDAEVTTKNVSKVSSDVKKAVDKLDLPKNVTVDFGGVTEQINETFTQLGLAMLAAIAIVYLLLVITFGGALTPFAILFSLPFTIIGALVGLFIAGETISASAMMGALMLIGIVVTNAIVLLDRVRHKEQEGLSTREALLEAGGTRLRPILMTALATVGALLPLALGFESTSGSLISKGLGVTVIGGLISSTALTLIIVPIVYEVLSKFRRKHADE